MRYLSDEWIDAADRAVQSMEPAVAPFSVSYTVTGGPDGDRSYTLDLAAPSVRLGVDAPVELRMPWDTAVAIASGERSAQRTFLDGSMQIAGDPQALLGAGDAMVAVEAAMASLRAHTEYNR